MCSDIIYTGLQIYCFVCTFTPEITLLIFILRSNCCLKMINCREVKANSVCQKVTIREMKMIQYKKRLSSILWYKYENQYVNKRLLPKSFCLIFCLIKEKESLVYLGSCGLLKIYLLCAVRSNKSHSWLSYCHLLFECSTLRGGGGASSRLIRLVCLSPEFE